MDEITYEDAIQQYAQTLVLYKGSMVYVDKVFEDKPLKCRIVHLSTQKKDEVFFNLEDFQPPARRIGMVNCSNTVIYVTRQPYRKMQVGMSTGNLNFQHLTCVPIGNDNVLIALKQCKKLYGKEIANAIAGDYPSLAKALETLDKIEGEGAIAFDRQFAVTKRREIVYKNTKVGDLPKGKTKVDQIVFNKGNEHLALAIGDNCAKILSTPR